MIFSLKEAKQKSELELTEKWVTGIVDFVKLIVLGIDTKYVVRRGEGYYNTIQILLPINGTETKPKVIVGIVVHDEEKDSVLFDLSWDSPGKDKFIIPLQKEDFARELKKTLTEL